MRSSLLLNIVRCFLRQRVQYMGRVTAGYKGWPVGMVLETTIEHGDLSVSDEGEEVRCFNVVLENTIKSQAAFLNKYLSR